MYPHVPGSVYSDGVALFRNGNSYNNFLDDYLSLEYVGRRYHNLIDCSLATTEEQPTKSTLATKISSKSVHNFLSNLANRQTDRQR